MHRGFAFVLLDFPSYPSTCSSCVRTACGGWSVSLESTAGLSPRTSLQDAKTRPVSFGLSPGGFAGGESHLGLGGQEPAGRVPLTHWLLEASSCFDPVLGDVRQGRGYPGLLPAQVPLLLQTKSLRKAEQKDSQEGHFPQFFASSFWFVFFWCPLTKRKKRCSQQ